DLPASDAVLRPGDIILDIDGTRTDTPAGLARRIADFAPDTEITIEFLRDGDALSRIARLGTRPGEGGPPASTMPAANVGPRLGLELAPLDDATREEASLNTRDGLFVRGVLADGPAAAAGIEPGDAILQIDGTSVTSLDSFRDALEATKTGERVRLLVERAGMTRFVVVRTGD
ncbi:MAG: PDZ domain-containing protein, partial [Phycisphaera sp.]|nr:PDZ domain-containing protein [Phycisphaera sp.]